MVQWRFGGLLTNESHPVLTSVPVDRNGFGFVSHRSTHCGLGLQDSGSQARARGIFDISCRILEANVCVSVTRFSPRTRSSNLDFKTKRSKDSAEFFYSCIYSMLYSYTKLHKVAQKLQQYCRDFTAILL
ncbi:hypothetical protein ALC56_12715 [Trachymyrmex septentrionalis]|uniref:Uncharacterized protein n=1 Tax=Trachymyrmex septentrionalis TaxID=34720 RepID=A0A195EYD5_9HYME|nr:hypothetical protein ALC56_12715 [Trachymyrmex septentrionalis]